MRCKTRGKIAYVTGTIFLLLSQAVWADTLMIAAKESPDVHLTPKEQSKRVTAVGRSEPQQNIAAPDDPNEDIFLYFSDSDTRTTRPPENLHETTQSANPSKMDVVKRNNTISGVHALENNTTGIHNTAMGTSALTRNVGGRLLGLPMGSYNTASGSHALYNNTIGIRNTASGYAALLSNTTGSRNTAIGYGADVSVGDLTNATAIGGGAIVNADNKIRLGNTDIAVIEGQVAFTQIADRTQMEKFRLVDKAEVLRKIRNVPVFSWNFIGQDLRFRHYGPTAQDFYAAFGHDGLGSIGTGTTLNSGDVAGILMVAIQALEERTQEIERLKAEWVKLQGHHATEMERLSDDLNHLKQVLNRAGLSTQAAWTP